MGKKKMGMLVAWIIAVIFAIIFFAGCDTETLVETGNSVDEKVSNTGNTIEEISVEAFRKFPCKTQFNQISEGIYPPEDIAPRCNTPEKILTWCQNNPQEDWGEIEDNCSIVIKNAEEEASAK
jgi:hypothetical protein